MSSEILKGFEPVAWMFDQPKLNIYNWTTTLKAECERGENIRPLHAADQLAQVVQQRDELLALVKGFHRKLETYRNVYSGDKELRRLLTECEAAIAKVKP